MAITVPFFETRHRYIRVDLSDRTVGPVAGHLLDGPQGLRNHLRLVKFRDGWRNSMAKILKSDVYPLQLLLRNVVNIFGNIWKFGYIWKFGWLFHVIPHFIQGTHHGFWWFQTLLKNMSQWEGWHPIYEMENKTCLKPPTSSAKLT